MPNYPIEYDLLRKSKFRTQEIEDNINNILENLTQLPPRGNNDAHEWDQYLPNLLSYQIQIKNLESLLNEESGDACDWEIDKNDIAEKALIKAKVTYYNSIKDIQNMLDDLIDNTGAYNYDEKNKKYDEIQSLSSGSYLSLKLYLDVFKQYLEAYRSVCQNETEENKGKLETNLHAMHDIHEGYAEFLSMQAVNKLQSENERDVINRQDQISRDRDGTVKLKSVDSYGII